MPFSGCWCKIFRYDTSHNGSAWISIFIFLLAFVFIPLQSPGQSDTRHAQPLYGLQHYTPPHGCQTNCIHSRLPARPTGARSEKHGETFLSTIKISQNQPHPTSPYVGCGWMFGSFVSGCSAVSLWWISSYFLNVHYPLRAAVAAAAADDKETNSDSAPGGGAKLN